jgi:eukaryotic-like serine/threonine-protein kinase
MSEAEELTEPQAPIAKEGDLIGPYRLEALLGRGAAGVVFRGVPLRGGAAVAVKVMPPPTEAMGETIRITLRAATITSSLRHPNVCTVYESGYLNDGRSYIAMELLEGVELKDVLKKEKALPDERSVSIVKQVLTGLGAVHKLGIVHRDIKPANIHLVKGKDGEEIAKILDFGIAYIKGAKESGAEGSRKGAIYGTPTYVSPEQIRSLEPDGRSDLYSVGVLLYRMVTGQVPFKETKANELYKAHLTKAPTKPTEISPYVSQFVEAAILKAMNKKPEARFQTAEDFVQALEASLRAEDNKIETAEVHAPLPVIAPIAPPTKSVALWVVGLISGLIGGVLFALLTPPLVPQIPEQAVTRVSLQVSADATDAEVTRMGVLLGKAPLTISAKPGEWLVLKAPAKKALAFQVMNPGAKAFTLQPAEAPPEPASEPTTEPTTEPTP